RHAAGEFGRVRAEQACAYDRMDAVGADHAGGVHCLAAGEGDLHLFVRLAHPDAPAVEPDRGRREAVHRIGEGGLQVATMQHEMRRAVTLDRSGAECEPVPGLAGTPVTNLPARWSDLDLCEHALEPERIENTGAVGADLDTGADLLEDG